MLDCLCNTGANRPMHLLIAFHQLDQGWETLSSQSHIRAHSSWGACAVQALDARQPLSLLDGALWNTGSDLEQKVKGDISAAFSWHLTFSYCSWNIRKPEGGYLLPEVWSIYCEASACCVCL